MCWQQTSTYTGVVFLKEQWMEAAAKAI